ncbi:ABC transporter substrate-binding protein [Streptosporangiaceae bacterium NEAU-GS5]|nr:ABC transporter substrate-binding protein [Streptosporangiaceae bacterium NEAU-GS5]
MEVSRRTLLLGSLAAVAGCSSSIKGSGTTSSGTIVIGFVSPQSGALAGFASGDNFVVDRIRKAAAYTGGFTAGGKKYDVQIVIKDTQSDPNRASQVARELILQNHADLIVTSSTPETTNPVATVCEAQGVPCVSTVVPWEAWYFARQADPAKPTPFTYTTMFFFGVDQFGGCFVPMWERVSTDKVVAGMFPNDADGNAFRGAWPDIIEKAGYTWVDGGAYTDGTTDYSSMIAKFRREKCEIFINAPIPPDFNTMWKQAAQQGFKPKLATVAKVLLFPADTEALGDLVNNIATDSWWGPYMPYKSSLTGETAKDLADAYQAASGKQWLQTLGSTYSLFEIAQKALTAVSDPHDHKAVAAELQKMNYAGISGPLDFTKGPVPGVAIQSPVGVQWKKGTNFPYEMVVVDNSLNKAVPIGGDLQATNA